MNYNNVYIGDFETTVYEGQERTEVWASAVVPLESPDELDSVQIFGSIDDTLAYFRKLRCNSICYYHNLKFDGAFWLSYLLNNSDFKTGLDNNGRLKNARKLKTGEFTYSITDKGQWYSISIQFSKGRLELRDSLKLLPFAVKEIGPAFNTKHRKTSMVYEGERYAGCEISESEREYIANDALVVKEALTALFNEGHTKLTIGSCCLSEYKRMFGEEEFNHFFPNLSNMTYDGTGENYDEFIRRSYKGGWCYVKPDKANKEIRDGLTLDVNSLYPSVMHSDLGYYYPVGNPKRFEGKPYSWMIKDTEHKNSYYFIHLKCRFEIKPGYLPFIQIKKNPIYKPNEMLTTSDYVDDNGKRYRYILKENGAREKIKPELVLTCIDYELFIKHYKLYEVEYLGGCYFRTDKGLFDDYINKYKELKMTSKGAKRTLAKLFLNNLYGKMATSTDSSYKVAYIQDDGSLAYNKIEEHNKRPVYIPVGSAITSYARRFTITAAQKNYESFVYSDTDSIHCSTTSYKIKGVKMHSSAFGCWALEGCWDKGIFVRQKTYIEHIISEEGEEVEPYYQIRCAGMGETVKRKIIAMLEGEDMELSDFKQGLCIEGNLKPKNINGGVVLYAKPFKIR